MEGDNEDGQSGAEERRAYPRLPHEHEGILTLKGARRRPCKVRDYCPGGLHLEVPRPAWDTRGAKAPPLATRGDPAVVSFTTDTPDGKREFEIRLTVARVFNGGLGVAFVEPNPTAVRALHQLAVREQAQGGTATVATMEAIRSACRVALADHVEPAFKTMMRDIGGPLVQAASDASNNAEQGKYFDAISMLDGSRASIASEVMGAIRVRIAEFGDESAAPRPRVTDDMTDGEFSEELSLVNVDEFEDFLVVSELVSSADLRCEKRLRELEQRLTGACGSPVTNDENPVSAAAVCHAFREAIGGFPLHRDARLLLYRELERHIVPLLDTMYGDINTELERLGVRPPPKPRRKVARAQNPAGSTDKTLGQDVGAAAGPPSETAPVGAEDVAQPAATDTFSAAPAVGSAVPATGETVAGAPGAVPAAPVYATGAALPGAFVSATGAGAPATAGVATGSTTGAATQPASLGAARTLLGLRRRITAPVGAVVADETAADPTPGFSGDQILTALDTLQSEGFGAAPEDAAGGLLAALTALLAGATSGGTQRALGVGETDPIALMDTVFRAIQKDHLLGEATLARIESLQPAVHKANLLEPGFFEDESHPARRALDSLGHLDAAIEDNRSVSEESVPALVDRILAPVLTARELDLEPLREAAESLDDLYADIHDAYEQNVAELVAAREAQEAFLRSRQKSEPVGGNTETGRKTQSLEWNVWLNRVRRLRVGDLLLASDPGATPRRLTVAWIGAGHEMIMLVDSCGRKADSPILQELAMRMRRGTATLLARTQEPLVTRALGAALAELHGGIEHSATHDRVTGLAKFKHFENELARSMTRALQEHLEHVVLHIKLDHHQTLCEQSGVAAADSLARAAAETLAENQRKGALIASFDDGVLRVLLEDCPVSEGMSAATRLCEALAKTTVETDDGGDGVSAAASIGLAVVTKRSPSTQAPLDAARAAAESAHAAGGSRVLSADLDEEEKHAAGPMMEWAPLLNRTLRGGEPRFRWQRIVPLHDDLDAAPFFELLLDPRDDDDKPVPPDKLLKAAVYYNHMLELDRWVIHNALACMAANTERLAEIGACAINLADETLADERLVAYLVDELLSSGVPPGKVCFEISEAAALTHRGLVEDLMFTLREYGCRFTMVDVGMGGSSHDHLDQLPVDFVKIDGIFVRDIATNAEDLAMVQSIHEIVRFLGKRTIAECVEDEDTLEILRGVGVDYAQGYGVDKPRYLDEDTLIGADGTPAPKSLRPAP